MTSVYTTDVYETHNHPFKAPLAGVFFKGLRKHSSHAAHIYLPHVPERNREVDQMFPVSSPILESKLLLMSLKYMVYPKQNAAKKEATERESIFFFLLLHFKQKCLIFGSHG